MKVNVCGYRDEVWWMGGCLFQGTGRCGVWMVMICGFHLHTKYVEDRVANMNSLYLMKTKRRQLFTSERDQVCGSTFCQKACAMSVHSLSTNLGTTSVEVGV